MCQLVRVGARASRFAGSGDREAVRVVPLGELNVDDVDMLTVVVVGSSDSRTVETGDGKNWVYTPRGYSGKAGTQMEKAG